MAKSGFSVLSGPARSLALVALLASAAPPVAAQEVQGPPDGFRLPDDGRPPAQGPADNGIPPLAAPTPTDPRRAPAAPVIVPEPARPAPRLVTPAAPAPRPAPAVRTPESSAPAQPADPESAPATTPASPSVPVNPGPVAPLPEAPDLAEPRESIAPISAPMPNWWQHNALWIAAALLLLGGAGWALRRRSVAGGPAEDVSPPLERTPIPPPRARQPVRPSPPPPSQTPPAPPPSPTLPVRKVEPPVPPLPPIQGRARLTMTLQLEAIELGAEAARVSFTLLLANSGERAATSGLVRIALQQAHPQQTAMIDRFFDGAGGSVLAEDVDIAPGDVGAIVRHALLPLAEVEPLLVAGYPSLIPVLAFDVTYHWDGDRDAFGQCAGAYVLGTSAAADGRVAPVRLDQGPRRLSGPVARVTELQRFV